MSHIELQSTSREIWEQKYQLKDNDQNIIDKDVDDMYKRVAKKLASNEIDSDLWYTKFLGVMRNGATPAGRIMSNAGAEQYKPKTSLINCTVSQIIPDTMKGILHTNMQAGITLTAGCGIGYEYSTLRPRDSFVGGAGAYTSGPISFMDIFDSTCFTVSSAGGRRGAQMGTFAVWHPDVIDFILAKRQDGTLRQFNLSLLVDNEFIHAVRNELDWDLVFPVMRNESLAEPFKTVWKELFWEKPYCDERGYTTKVNGDGKVMILCKIYKTLKAVDMWDTIMRSTYDFAEPGFLIIDKINDMNNNWFCEKIRATNPCGEQPLPPEGSCLLGSVNLAKYVVNPFTDVSYFDWDRYISDIHVFSRLLDNVVEFNGLPLDGQVQEIEYKRRHGMGFLGLGSALSLLGITYGSDESLAFTEKIQKTMAIESYRVGIELAKEKGPAPIFNDTTDGVCNKKLWSESKYLLQIWELEPGMLEDVLLYGCRYTHATSIAPTGTIALSINNNVSNGIEPTFAHKYTRNVIKAGSNSKIAVDVYSYEMLLYKEIYNTDVIPEWFSTTDNVTPKAHVDIQAVAQKWCDSSISKTINIPTDMKFEDFKDIYMYAYDRGLKGCTTFRFNPEAFQGVLVKSDDLTNTKYDFILTDGSIVTASGDEMIMYDGEEVQANNLFDAIKEGYYGKF